MFGTEEKRIYGADISSPYENDLVIEPLRLFIGLPPDEDIFKLHDDIVSPEHNDEGKMSKALAESCKKKCRVLQRCRNICRGVFGVLPEGRDFMRSGRNT